MDCDNTFFEQTGTFESPSYPLDYPLDVNCTTIIKAPEGFTVVLEILDFSIESDGDTCVNDYDTFSVHDGEDDSAPLLGKYCGELIPEMIMSSGEYLYVVFKSDGSTNARGYQATFQFKGMMKEGFFPR